VIDIADIPLDDEEPRVLLLGAESFPDDPGGLNRYFHDLRLALSSNQRHIPAVVVGPAEHPPPGLAVVPRGPLPARLSRYGLAARRLSRSVELVDAHFALYGMAAMLAGAMRKRPLVTHFHGPWAGEGRSAGERSRLKAFARRTTERVVYRQCEVAITLSGFFKRVLVEKFGIAPWSVAVLPPAVDLNRFEQGDTKLARERIGVPVEGPVVLSVRRLVPRMGLENLLQAWALLEPGDAGRLLIVGEGPNREKLERIASELGIARAVLFRGAIGEAELVACYQAADATVVPSTELEGFGLTVLESLACGTPVITTNVGGLPEATSGLAKRMIVPPGQPEPLANAVRGVLTGEAPTATAAECRTHAERYSLQSLGERHRELYRRAVSRPISSRLRVVYIDHTAQLSGAELGLLRLIPELSGVEAHVILGEEGPLEVRLREAGISTEVLSLGDGVRELRRDQVRPSTLGIRAPLMSGAYVMRLARRLRRLKPDLVHANSLKGGLLGAPAARIAGRRVVWQLHDRLAPDYMPPAAVRLLRMAIPRLAREVIVNSDTTRGTLGPAGESKSTVIPLPIELPRSPVQVREKVRRIGMVGRLAPWKGQEVLLEAAAREFASQDVETVIIGSAMFGEDAYAEGLRRRARELGIERSTNFRGFVADVPSALASLDVLVHASITPEPFGQVVLEGMAAGLPVVAAKAGGPAEIIRDGVDGLLYPPGDVDALAGCLRRLNKDRALRERLARAARDRSGDFASPLVARQVDRVYRRALERAR
jgi:glycosyltransferase involved in cell wall biosynthesis